MSTEKKGFPLDQKDLASLRIGDKFYTEGFFQGLADKQIKWTVCDLGAFGYVYVRGTYFGIDLGRFRLSPSSKGVQFCGQK